jgi:2-oxoisovalerate dehydrogenase E1 component beta subunit
MADALNRALHDAMAEDPAVVVFGEDVGRLGGVFRVSDGLLGRFGEARCFDTPVAESGIVGTALGMALYGVRPVVEMQFDAFSYPAFEQVTSHLAKIRNRARGRVSVPLVVRVPYGGGIGAVEHHSDSSEAYYAATPGLTVMTPSGAADAYSMLREAISSEDPVIFLEPKARYWVREPVVLPVRTEPASQAVVRRAGSDVTLISYGATVALCLEAAEAAQELGFSVEVVDLRSLSPLDASGVAERVKGTGRAVVVHEASVFGGFGAEVAARLSEMCFHHLLAPVLRVGGFDIPYPPPSLEAYHLPSLRRIVSAIERLQWEDEHGYLLGLVAR